jgi:hypothetical protein
MAFIPDDAKWYLADIVTRTSVDGDSRTVLHTNRVLVQADSPDDAYVRALELGRQRETSYENPIGRRVQIQFLGLRELYVIYDELEHGAELIYEEEIGLSDEEIRTRIQEKDQLQVFQPIEPRRGGPDYTSAAVLKEAVNLLKRKSSSTRDTGEP